MEYKLLTTIEEAQQVKELCEKNNINSPGGGVVIIAVNDSKEVVGIISLARILMIEPLVSNNPLVAKNLFDMAEVIIKQINENKVRCFTESANEDLFNKVGFYKAFKDKIIMEKIYGE